MILPLTNSSSVPGFVTAFSIPWTTHTLTRWRLVSIHHINIIYHHDLLCQIFHHLFPSPSIQRINQVGLFFLCSLRLLFYHILSRIFQQLVLVPPCVCHMGSSRVRGDWGSLPESFPRNACFLHHWSSKRYHFASDTLVSCDKDDYEKEAKGCHDFHFCSWRAILHLCYMEGRILVSSSWRF
jgi:hypothetical protein